MKPANIAQITKGIFENVIWIATVHAKKTIASAMVAGENIGNGVE